MVILSQMLFVIAALAALSTIAAAIIPNLHRIMTTLKGSQDPTFGDFFEMQALPRRSHRRDMHRDRMRGNRHSSWAA